MARRAKPAASAQSRRLAAPSRPYWTGQLRLALVALPVKVFSATKSGARIPLHQIDRKSGKRIRYEKVVPGVGPVDIDRILKGFEIRKGHYVLLDDKDLDSVRVDSRKTIELVQFVDTDEIPPLYYEKPFYVVPDGDLAEDGFVVIREALHRAQKVGLGQMALRGYESIVAIRSCGRGLLLETLRYPDEIRKADPLFAGIEDGAPAEELISMASQLIEQRSGPFDASRFEDHYTRALLALIERKTKQGSRVSVEIDKSTHKGSGKIVDLMAALQASVDSKKTAATTKRRGKASARAA
ncbi:MAG: Ku protein [Geminicoccaceae bacterium]